VSAGSGQSQRPSGRLACSSATDPRRSTKAASPPKGPSPIPPLRLTKLASAAARAWPFPILGPSRPATGESAHRPRGERDSGQHSLRQPPPLAPHTPLEAPVATRGEPGLACQAKRHFNPVTVRAPAPIALSIHSRPPLEPDLSKGARRRRFRLKTEAYSLPIGNQWLQRTKSDCRHHPNTKLIYRQAQSLLKSIHFKSSAG